MAPSKDLGHGMLAVVHPNEGIGKAMEPPHVHVYDADGEAKIDLRSLEVLAHQGMKKSQITRAVSLVERKRNQLLELWHASRPTG
jgi:hypothetical protein